MWVAKTPTATPMLEAADVDFDSARSYAPGITMMESSEAMVGDDARRRRRPLLQWSPFWHSQSGTLPEKNSFPITAVKNTKMMKS